MRFGIRHVLVLMIFSGVAFAVVPWAAEFIGSWGVVSCDWPLEPCEGVLTLDGQPLPDACISIANSQVSCTGVTESNGAFRMCTGHGPKAYPGVPPGNYKATITRTIKDTDKFDLSKDYRPIPTRYLNPVTSPLIISIPEGGVVDLKLQMTSQ